MASDYSAAAWRSSARALAGTGCEEDPRRSDQSAYPKPDTADQIQHRCKRVQHRENSEADLAGGSTGDSQEAHYELGRVGRQERQDEAFGELKCCSERPHDLEQEKACQAEPARLFHLPG